MVSLSLSLTLTCPFNLTLVRFILLANCLRFLSTECGLLLEPGSLLIALTFDRALDVQDFNVLLHLGDCLGVLEELGLVLGFERALGG